MTDLLTAALQAHGGLDRRRSLRTVSATYVSTGELLDRKAPRPPDPRRVAAQLHQQSAVTTFTGTDKRGVFAPNRVAIEGSDGAVVAERLDPRSAFAGHDLDTPWDPLHAAYFGGYAMWTYLNTPFFFTMDGVSTEEIEPIREKGETWRGLRVFLPPHLAGHSVAQDFYFGEDFLLRRQDYTLDVGGGANVANYALAHVTADGIVVPTKRRAYLCDDKYKVLYDRLMMCIDMTDVGFS